MEMGGKRHALTTLPQERPGTHCIGDCKGPRTSLEGWWKSRLHGDSIPRPFSL